MACLSCCCSPALRGDSGAPPAGEIQRPDSQRERLQELVCNFVRHASSEGQLCRAGGAEGFQDAEYRLLDRASKLELRSAAPEKAFLVSWNIRDLLVRSAHEDATQSAKCGEACDLMRSIILAGEAGRWILVVGSEEERERFVCIMQILQLYQGLASRLAGFSTPKKSEAQYGEGGLLRPPASSPATSLVSPFAFKAPAPPPTPQKLQFQSNCL
ncbi:unnamed protein product [Durusdinium trenchii]|uniref:Uncharacterized protein n=2 Tax=Durusdinium trenchii TaxID=1381693 RepID=A0ABP0JBQ0_9DINO